MSDRAACPRLVRKGEALYFERVPGELWRVHDAAFGPPLAEPFRYAALSLGNPRARYRVFVPPDRQAARRSYDFKAEGAVHVATLDVIVQQFAKSAYVASTRVQPGPTPPGTPLGQ